MRVLFLNSIGKNKWGGGEKWMLMAASGLYKLGHQVYIGCARNSIIEQNAIKQRNDVVNIHFNSDFDFIGFIRLIRFLKQHGISHVICGQNKDSKISAVAAKSIGGVIVLARHGLQLISKKIKYKYIFSKLIHGIITNSQSIKNEYDSFNWFAPDFVKVIHNGFTVPMSVQEESLRSLFNIEEEEVVIYSAGRLAKQKGYQILIQAAQIAHSNNKRWKFVVAGKGKLENNLKLLIKKLGLEKIFYFQGFVDDVLPFVKNSDIFVLPSYYEGMPNAVMEAMGMGKCCVVSDVNGNKELIENEKEGLLVNCGNPNELYLALCKVCDNRELREMLGRNAMIKIKEQFSEAKMVETLEDYLKSIQMD